MRSLTQLLLVATVVFVNPWSHADQAPADPPRELVFLNWNEYVDQQVIEAFEKQHNARVKQVYFATEDETTELMITTGGRGFDVILVPGSSIASYARRNWLTPLDKGLLPHLEHVEERWIDAFDQSATYGSPYLWGTMGIVYRQDLVGEPPRSWRDLLEPRPEWRGKIQMPPDMLELVGVSLKAQGRSLNDESKEAFDQATALLLSQRPHVHDYAYPDLTNESKLVAGEVWMAVTYNGDALLLKENADDHPLSFVVPEEGALLWCDYLSISAQSRQPELAHAFLDFLQRPEMAARTAETLYYASTNRDAEPLLSEGHREDPIIHPPADVIQRSEFLTPKRPRTLKRWNSFHARLVEQ